MAKRRASAISSRRKRSLSQAEIVADGTEDDVGGVAGSAFKVPATEAAIGQNWSRKSALCDRWSFCLTTGRFSVRIRRRLCKDDRAGTTRQLSGQRRYSPPSRAIGRSGLDACSTAHSRFHGNACFA